MTDRADLTRSPGLTRALQNMAKLGDLEFSTNPDGTPNITINLDKEDAMDTTVTERPAVKEARVQEELGGPFENLVLPKQTIEQALGPAGQAVARLDEFHLLLDAWKSYLEAVPSADSGDVLVTLDRTLPDIAAAIGSLHLGLSALHRRAAQALEP